MLLFGTVLNSEDWEDIPFGALKWLPPPHEDFRFYAFNDPKNFVFD